MEQKYSKRRIDMLNNPLEGFAGKNSAKLANYYDPLCAFYENSTNVKGLPPYGREDKDFSPKGDRRRTDDIHGATPNAFGNARFVNVRDIMDISDIPGSKPKLHGNVFIKDCMDISDIKGTKPRFQEI